MTMATEEKINTHNLVCDFGKHKGKLWTRIPVSYLIWLVGSAPMEGGTMEQRAKSAQNRAIAKAEIERRGTTIPEVEITGHAIDSASLRVRKVWHALRNENEGLHSWLCRTALEAKSHGIRDNKQQDRIHHNGVVFVFEQEGEYPIVKTVMRSKLKYEDWPEIPDASGEVLKDE